MKRKKHQSRDSLEAFARRIHSRPSDPDTFMYAVSVFQSAFLGDMPGCHIQPPPDGFEGYALADVPMNRGMLAVMRELPHLSTDDRMTLVSRIMAFVETVKAVKDDERFFEHVIPAEDGTMVSHEFQRAVATCKFLMHKERALLDLDDLRRIIAEAP